MKRYTFVFRSREGDIEWALIQFYDTDEAARAAARHLLLVVAWPVVDVRQSATQVAWYERCTGVNSCVDVSN